MTFAGQGAKMSQMAKTNKIDTKSKVSVSGPNGASRRFTPKFQPVKDAETVTSTEAKNEFARMLEKAIRGDCIVITKHEEPKAVLMSVEQYEALVPERRINTLTEEFNAMMDRMQTPAARKAMDEAFHASPEELGRVAVAAARKRR